MVGIGGKCSLGRRKQAALTRILLNLLVLFLKRFLSNFLYGHLIKTIWAQMSELSPYLRHGQGANLCRAAVRKAT